MWLSGGYAWVILEQDMKWFYATVMILLPHSEQIKTGLISWNFTQSDVYTQHSYTFLWLEQQTTVIWKLILITQNILSTKWFVIIVILPKGIWVIF